MGPYARWTRYLSVTFDATNRPPTGGSVLGNPSGSAVSGLLGLTDASSNLDAAGDCAAGWDATPSTRARHATTTTLFISAPLAQQRHRRRAGCSMRRAS